MSILIKGMKMPKEGCRDCPLIKRVRVVFDFCPILKREVNGNVERGGKPHDCPLIELPDHGDLIDRSKLEDEFIGDAFSGKGGYAVWSGDILSAPVVIPAERSEASPCDNCDRRSDVGCSWCKMLEGSEDEHTD